jgi:transcriptional regulator GlxA family with amidase domain
MAFLPAPVRLAIAAMRAAIENPTPLPTIAAKAGVSPRQLERLFLRHTGVTPLRYYLQIRLDRARELLLYSDRSVIEIAVSAGFTSTSHFSTWYKRIHGVRPSDMRHEPGVAAPAAVAPGAAEPPVRQGRKS